MSFQPRDVLVIVPGFAALGLGLLYATGAVIKSGQLRGEGLNVRDTLPLVPLEQILALGIGTIVTSLIWVVIFAALLWLYLGVKGSPEQIRMSPRTYKVLRVFTWVIVPLAIVYWFYSFAFFGAISIIAATFLGGTVERFRHRGRAFVVYVVLAYFLLVLTARIGTAYASPDPLPQASLQVEGEPGLTRGALIVSTGEAWYLTNKSKTYRAVARSRVSSAVVRSQEREREPRPVLKVVWQWLKDR